MTPTQFKDSQEAILRRMVRDAVKKGPFTKAERDVTLATVNHWFHHKSGGKGYIHPSREMMAKKAAVSVRTVAHTFDLLRAQSVLRPVSGIKGGKGKATRYVVDVWVLLQFCGFGWVDEFLRGHAANTEQSCTVNDAEFARYTRAEIAHCLNDVGTCQSHGWKH